MEAQTNELQQVWLKAQIFKTQYARGHYDEALCEIHTLLEDLNNKHDFMGAQKSEASLEYLFFKLVY